MNTAKSSSSSTTIEKEFIPELHFPNTDILSTDKEIRKRDHDLRYALKLGNNYHRKVKIDFSTLDGPKRVETTIWSLTEDNVILKGGIYIPKHCVISVEQY